MNNYCKQGIWVSVIGLLTDNNSRAAAECD